LLEQSIEPIDRVGYNLGQALIIDHDSQVMIGPNAKQFQDLVQHLSVLGCDNIA